MSDGMTRDELYRHRAEYVIAHHAEMTTREMAAALGCSLHCIQRIRRGFIQRTDRPVESIGRQDRNSPRFARYQERVEFIRVNDDTMEIREICAALGMSYNGVRSIRRNLGLTARKPGRKPKAAPQPVFKPRKPLPKGVTPEAVQWAREHWPHPEARMIAQMVAGE